MNNKVYYKAVQVAKSYADGWYRDVVHEAYLRYYKTKSANLFDQHEGTVLRYVKYTYQNFNRSFNKATRSGKRMVPYETPDLGSSFVHSEAYLSHSTPQLLMEAADRLQSLDIDELTKYQLSQLQ
jgi:hypothetical protein